MLHSAVWICYYISFDLSFLNIIIVKEINIEIVLKNSDIKMMVRLHCDIAT